MLAQLGFLAAQSKHTCPKTRTNTWWWAERTRQRKTQQSWVGIHRTCVVADDEINIWAELIYFTTRSATAVSSIKTRTIVTMSLLANTENTACVSSIQVIEPQSQLTTDLEKRWVQGKVWWSSKSNLSPNLSQGSHHNGQSVQSLTVETHPKDKSIKIL